MVLSITKYKAYKSVTKGGEPSKIYLTKVLYEDQTTAAIIRKYHLTKEEIDLPEYTLKKVFDGHFLYEEFITLKYETLMTICATMFNRDELESVKILGNV